MSIWQDLDLHGFPVKAQISAYFKRVNTVTGKALHFQMRHCVFFSRSMLTFWPCIKSTNIICIASVKGFKKVWVLNVCIFFFKQKRCKIDFFKSKKFINLTFLCSQTFLTSMLVPKNYPRSLRMFMRIGINVPL